MPNDNIGVSQIPTNPRHSTTGTYCNYTPNTTTVVESQLDLMPKAITKPAVTQIKESKQQVLGGMLTGDMILKSIKNGDITIDPFDPTKINPNSYNLTLNSELLVYSDDILDFKKKNNTKKIQIPSSGLVLYPDTLYIGRTNEKCGTDRFIPLLNGRSSVGRLGICIHITAGFGDIGFNGTWTLEITAVKPVRVYPNIEICQVSYLTPYGSTDIQYDGRYQGQIDATASRSNQEKKVYV